ncbi:siderophore ABC transporter substrate-binding protein [Devosia pacifica]|nr:siderophore ABC transporter substrate-binding protein [Devosia pacifica]
MLFNRVALAATAFGVMSLAVQAQEITVEHAQGETTLPETPQTVLTFDLAALDTLDALGIDVTGVPETTYPEHLSEYAGEDYEKIGSLFEPDYEAVNAIQPDLIIVAGRSSSVYSELAAIAPTVDLSNDWEDFEGSIKDNARILGEIFDKTDEVEQMIADFDETKAETQEAAADAGTGLVVLTSGGEVTAYGPGSRFGWVHSTAGVTPAVEDVEAATHGDAISFEFILETNPDWLFVIDRDAAVSSGGEAAEQVLDNELMAQTTAWSEDQVVYIDPVRAYIINGGLPALHAMVEQIGDALAGD